MSYEFVIIGGCKASGKGLVRGIIDGSPELFVSPFHECFCDYDLFEMYLRLRESGDRFEAELSNFPCFSQILKASSEGKGIDFGGDTQSRQNLSFDSQRFISGLKRAVSIKWRSSSYFISDLYSSMILGFGLNPADYRRIVFLSSGYADALYKASASIENLRVVYVSRPVIDCVAGLMDRRAGAFAELDDLDQIRKLRFQKWASKEFLSECFNQRMAANRLAKTLPSSILRIQFDSLFYKRSLILEELQDFLGADLSGCSSNFTVMGSTVKFGDKLLEKPINNAASVLTRSELAVLEELVNEISAAV